MEFDKYYVVLLKKGPTWTADSNPELEALQDRHLAHLAAMGQSGKLAVAGPVAEPEDTDIRGINVLPCDQFDSADEARALVEQDPAIQAGRLRAEFMTWYTPKGSIYCR
jgi:uncharacterized protein